MTKPVAIIAACRTAIGNFGGTLAPLTAGELGAVVVKEAVRRAGIAPDAVDEVIMGQVITAAARMNPARQAARGAGLPDAVPALTINHVCGSGLRAVLLAANEINSGAAEVVVAGGQESMSNAPHALPGSRTGWRLGDVKAVDTMISDGLWDVFNDYHMGQTAENVAQRYGLTRAEQDEFATASQNKAEAAQQAGRFADEIVAVEIPQRRKDPIVFATDEYPRHGCTVEALAKLRPAFTKDGTVTAGNASGINDGAAAMVVTSVDHAARNNLPVLATLECGAFVGLDPSVMGLGPHPASTKALGRAGWRHEDLDLVEANEAFAAQALAVNREMGWDPAKVNVNGGAIALGHPIGASGCRVAVTLLHEMRRRQAAKGVATLCMGGGMGIAACFAAA